MELGLPDKGAVGYKILSGEFVFEEVHTYDVQICLDLVNYQEIPLYLFLSPPPCEPAALDALPRLILMPPGILEMIINRVFYGVADPRERARYRLRDREAQQDRYRFRLVCKDFCEAVGPRKTWPRYYRSPPSGA